MKPGRRDEGIMPSLILLASSSASPGRALALANADVFCVRSLRGLRGANYDGLRSSPKLGKALCSAAGVHLVSRARAIDPDDKSLTAEIESPQRRFVLDLSAFWSEIPVSAPVGLRIRHFG
jgi:hypothetical protein